MNRVFPAFFLVLLLAGCAATGPQPEPTAETAKTESEVVSPEQFIAWLNDLEDGLEIGEPRALNASEMREVDILADELRGLLEGVDDIAALNPNQQAMIFNKSQQLWGVVSGQEAEQVVCRRERQAGTHFQRTTCRSVAELRREDRETQMWLRQIRGPGPMPGGG